MFKRFFQAGALFVLCALLVYAPEIYTAVSGPDVVSTPERVLLRIVLCTQDTDSASSFYKALAAYQKAHPAVHLRVTRADSDQLAALDVPLPDVYLFDDEIELPFQTLFLPLSAPQAESDAPVAGEWDGVRYALPFSPAQGGTLLCAASAQARETAVALDFVAYFHNLVPGESAAP